MISTIAKMSQAERMQRYDKKRAEVLKIALKFGWINVAAASELLGVTRPAAARTVKSLASDGLLFEHELAGMPRRIWYSISEAGVAEAYFLDDLDLPSNLQPGRWKIAVQNYQHEQDVLLIAIKSQKSGAEVCLAEFDQNDKKRGRSFSSKYPDFLIEISRKIYGIEIEREVKSQRRYKEIVASHWRAIERGHYDCILYLTPDQPTCDRLTRIVKSVFESVRLGGRERALTQPERQRFGFATYCQGVAYFERQTQAIKE